jgi:hypothetical protein
MNAATDWVWNGTLNRWCVDFDGANDYIVATTLGNWFSSGYATGITLAGWFKHTLTENRYNLFSSLVTGPKHGFQFLINALMDGNIVANKMAAILVRENTTTDYSGIELTNANSVLNSGQFVHIAMTAPPGWASAGLKFWINGVSQPVTAAAQDIDAAPNDLSFGLSMGCRNFNGVFGLPYPGTMTDPVIYNRALSAAEISALADPSNVMLSGLILPPRRRLWAVSGGAPPATNYLLTLRAANKRGNKMGGVLIGKQ